MECLCKIHHRVNSIEGLMQTDSINGVEIDVRYHENELILHHDPFEHHIQKLTTLNEFAKNYKNKGPLILNLKTEGIEKKCIEIMNQYQIQNWFFLDMSPPFLVKFANFAENRSIANFSKDNLAIRFSEKEPIEYALSFVGTIGWVWVDCFNDLPLTLDHYNILKDHFKICIVSPELQGHSTERIYEFKNKLKNMEINAVCSKRLDLW